VLLDPQRAAVEHRVHRAQSTAPRRGRPCCYRHHLGGGRFEHCREQEEDPRPRGPELLAGRREPDRRPPTRRRYHAGAGSRQLAGKRRASLPCASRGRCGGLWWPSMSAWWRWGTSTQGRQSGAGRRSRSCQPPQI